MFPDKYKHPSKTQKTFVGRIADKLTAAFRKPAVESTGTWIV